MNLPKPSPPNQAPKSQGPTPPLQALGDVRLTWDQAIELLLTCGLSHAFAFRIVKDMFRNGFAEGADSRSEQLGEAWFEGHDEALSRVAECLEGHPGTIEYLQQCGIDLPATADSLEAVP